MTLTPASNEDLTLPGTGMGTEPRRPSGAPLVKGTVVGRYVVLARIGAGGMGAVYAAYDPQLDRKVAVKLLHPEPDGGSNPERRTRLVREAQALAKLSHPNVVAVHDVGTMDDQVWMAMEFVKGQTLADWLEDRGRSWPEVLTVMSAAGEGLSAAHEAGLLHRDFKLDNVMIDDRERVRVMDFGLARAGDDRKIGRTVTGMTPRTEPGPLSMQVTHDGALMGTPGYMAPEQFSGQAADDRSDQFSFSVALWEALYGQRPFGGDDMAELIGHLLDGELRSPPADAKVPGWLRQICARGLSRDPSARFDSLRALLDALSQGQIRARRRRWVVTALGLALVGVTAASLWIWRRGQLRAGCAAEGAGIADVWNESSRVRLQQRLHGDTDDAQAVADKVLSSLDAYASEWTEHRTNACVQGTITEDWNAQTLRRAQWCLDERKRALASLVGVLTETEGPMVGHAAKAAAALDPSAPCLDLDVLNRAVAPPDPEDEPEVRALLQQLARARTLGRASQVDEGLRVIEQAQPVLDELSWAPLSAEARSIEAWLLEEAGALEQAEQVGFEAYLAAAEAQQWSTAAEVAARLATLIGQERARPQEGRRWVGHARMAASLSGDPLGLHAAARHSSLGAIALNTGDTKTARQEYGRALELYREALPATHPLIGQSLRRLGAVEWTEGSMDAAQERFEQALAITEEALGPEHPDVAVILSNLAAIYYGEKAWSEALALYERALAIYTTMLPPEHPSIAQALDNLALPHQKLGDLEQAHQLHMQALHLLERSLGPEHPSVALSLANLGDFEQWRDRPHDAVAYYERAVAIYDLHEGFQQHELGTRFILAQLLVFADRDLARAKRLAEQARDGYRALGEGKNDARLRVEEWMRTVAWDDSGTDPGAEAGQNSQRDP